MTKTKWTKLAQVSMLALTLCGVAAFAGAPAEAKDVKKLAILTPEDPTDYGWNQQGFDAAKAVAEKMGIEFMPATGLGYGDVHPTLRELADDGASLMIAHASGYNTAAPEIGAEKGVAVAIVDKPDAIKAGEVADYTLSGHEGAYLAGILAAKTSTTKSVGIVVSGEPPSWNSQSAAFAQGVKATDPAVKILYAVIGPAAYADAAGGRRVTESVIGAGADVIRTGAGDKDIYGTGMSDAVYLNANSGLDTLHYSNVTQSVHRCHRRQDRDRQGPPALIGGLESGSGLYGDGRGSEGRQVRYEGLFDPALRRFGAVVEDQEHPGRRLGLGQRHAQADCRRVVEDRAGLGSRKGPRFDELGHRRARPISL